MFRERLIIAIDKTEELYWGEIDNLFVTGGKREASTNYAFRYLTVACVLRGQRFFLHVRPLTDKDDNDALLVEEALEELRTLGFQMGTLLCDREFYNGKIILICNVQKMGYVIPAVKNDRFQSKVAELRKEGKKLPRIIEDYEVADKITNLIIYEEKNSKGEMEVFGFITNVDARELAKDVDAIIELYRMRWGIENAHKYEDGFRISTNSTDGIIRFFFFLLGVIFHNVWVLLRLLAGYFPNDVWICSGAILQTPTASALGENFDWERYDEGAGALLTCPMLPGGPRYDHFAGEILQNLQPPENQTLMVSQSDVFLCTCGFTG